MEKIPNLIDICHHSMSPKLQLELKMPGIPILRELTPLGPGTKKANAVFEDWQRLILCDPLGFMSWTYESYTWPPK